MNGIHPDEHAPPTNFPTVTGKLGVPTQTGAAQVADPTEYPLDVERQRDRYADMIEEYRKREASQDTIRKRLTAERDEARIKVERLNHSLNDSDAEVERLVQVANRLTKERNQERAEFDRLRANIAEDGEYLAMVEGQRARALATIERVKAVMDRMAWLKCKAAEDEDAGYRSALNTAVAYETAERLINEALDPPKATT